MSFEQCHTLEELFSGDNRSDNHLLHSVPWPRHHRAISITLEGTERTQMQNEGEMHAHERKMIGHECTLE